MPPKEITLGSLFDGIAGFPYAAGLHGIRSVWASEIEPFCIKVSQKHFPEMKHLGSITDINGAEIEPVDIITFGSPCQDLSVAGKRQGLKGERSGLFMEAIRIIREMREATNGVYPTYAVWENVPGAFSSNRGQDFRTVLEEIMEAEIPMPGSGKWAPAGMVRGRDCSLAWRTFDAQYWGVPQRRRRIYLVTDFRGQRAPEILFEREGVPGDTAEGGKAREEAAAGAGDGVEATVDFGRTADRIRINAQVSATLQSCGGGMDAKTGLYLLPFGAATVQGDLFPCVATLAVRTAQTNENGHGIAREKANTLDGAQGQAVVQKTNYLAPWESQRRRIFDVNSICPTLDGNPGGLMFQNYAVRRLTPIECLRLQGFPDNWLTDIPGYSDTAAYKAIGNSLAIPPTKWILGRIRDAIMGKLCPKMRI